MKAGLPVDIPDADNQTALLLGCKYGNEDFIEFLLEKQADINRTDFLGNTPLIYASNYGAASIVELLIKNKALVNLSNKEGKTALHMAAQGGKADVVKMLLGANINLNASDNRNSTALHIAAARGHIECHGITESGGLKDQYYANGARFSAAWDKINLADSTVKVTVIGYCRDDSGEEYKTRFESVIKVELLKAHDRPPMHDYYKANSGEETYE